jgi:hypothetical protein
MDTHDNRWSVVGLVLLVGAAAGFFYWYWSPGLPFELSSRTSDDVENLLTTESGATQETGAALQPAPQATIVPASKAVPVLAPFCPPGQPARFVLGFAQLKDQLGEAMGEPLECEHVNLDNGDALQQTTTGLAVYSPGSGALQFTDGWQHWALIGDELVAWEGEQQPTPMPASGPSALEPGSAVRVVRTDGQGVAWRAQPDDTSRLPSGLVEGTVAQILDRTSGYVRLRGPAGREGWVPERYLDPAG